MKNRLTNAGVLGNAHIKTGTLRDVRAIAGYVAGADGQSYIVVSFINNDHAEARAPRTTRCSSGSTPARTDGAARRDTRRAHGLMPARVDPPRHRVGTAQRVARRAAGRLPAPAHTQSRPLRFETPAATAHDIPRATHVRKTGPHRPPRAARLP